MRSNKRPSNVPFRQLQWRQFAAFLVRRRARVLLTIFLALFVDSWGGRLLQHNLADVHDPKALLGLALVFTGCALLAWAAGSRSDQFPSAGNGPYTFIKDLRFFGLLGSVAGLCLLIDDPKNIWLLLGPVILLDLIRLRREDYDTHGRFAWQPVCAGPEPAAGSSWLTIARRSLESAIQRIASSIERPAQPFLPANGPRQAEWWLRSRSYAPVLIVPVVALAVIGYAWPFDSLEFHETWEVHCLLVSFVGLAIRMLAAGSMLDKTSGRADFRNTAMLNTDGVFSVVRHPRYVGDFTIGLGVVSIPFVWWLPLIYSLVFWFYYKQIILIEDEDLRQEFGIRFDEWALVTPALVPRLSKWRPPSYSFSFRMALKREHAGLFVVIALHSSIEWLEHLVLDRRVMLEVFWIVLGLTGLTAYILVRHLAKHTRVLNVPAG
jgi:protein-S-isoprenylcysteine O-methyltransferase Ste14